MSSRSKAWLRIYARALAHRAGGARRRRVARPRRFLIAHHLLLGDTILLTATVAKVRAQVPDAEIVHVMPHGHLGLFEGRPYGAHALGWNPRDPRSLDPLFAQEPFDVALVAGDSRYSWLALAMGAADIVALEGDRPAYKHWPVTRFVPMPPSALSLTDLFATLMPGAPPPPYAPADWPAPRAAPFERPAGPYVVLHVGASVVHKQWSPAHWAQLADALSARGLEVCWSAGPGEESIVAAIPGNERFVSYAGRLDLPQLWHLLAHASALVSCDTSVAHLGRVVCAPTLILFGPSSPVLGGRGDFWQRCPARELAIDPFECRDQTHLFKREVQWVRRCTRSLAQCAGARCMQALTVPMVLASLERLLAAPAAVGDTAG